MSHDNDRSARFEREARVLASLNHPSIAAIYGLEESGGQKFLVMELVPGKTLAERIKRGAIPVDEAMGIATQITEALESAHEAGVIHRDIKPGNIMVTDTGVIKLLDFGLAKLTEPVESTESAAATTMSAGTRTGMIVGTVAYMSPEQANGTKVDARSDIYSFGVVLFEMISGRRPSGAEAAPDSAPRDLRKIVARCLQMDPSRRFQLMDDLRMALEDVDLSAETSAAPVAPAARRWVLLAVLVLLGAAAGTGIAWWLKPDRPSRGPHLTRLTMDSGLTTGPALSPDGRLVTYASDRSGEGNLDIWVQQVAGGAPVRLTYDTADESEPSFSPDTSKIAFRSERDGGGVYVVSAFGGDARRIADEGRRPRWSPDGRQIAYWTGVNTDYLWHIADSARIYVVNAVGGEPHRILPSFSIARFPVWSSDGMHLIFLGTREPTPRDQGEWWVTSLGAGTAVPAPAYDELRKNGLAPSPESSFVPDQWTTAGQVLFSARLRDSTNIWQVPVAANGRIAGPPTRLTAGTGLETNPSVADVGILAFSTHTNDIDLWSLPTDTTNGKPNGPMQRLTQDPAIDYYPAFLPGGSKVFFNSSRTRSIEMLLKDIATGKESVSTVISAQAGRAIVARDGSKVLFRSGPPDRWSALPLLSGGATRSSTPQTICEGCDAVWDLSADNRWILHGRNSDSIIAARELASGKITDFLNAPGEVISRLQISLDDRWVAFNHRYGGATRIIVAPFKPGTTLSRDQWIPITNGETQDNFPMWSPDSGMLYFISNADGELCIWARRIDRSTGRPAGEAFPVWHFHEPRRSMNGISFGLRGFAVARDHLVVNLSESSGNIWMATSSPLPTQQAK